MTFKNPFVSPSGQAHKEYFIGRTKEIGPYVSTNIETTTFTNKWPSNLAIIGIPNIGKSSLADKAIVERKDELQQKNVLLISMDVSIFVDSLEFFSSLVTQCTWEMEKIGCLTPRIKQSASSVADIRPPATNLIDKIQDFFAAVSEVGYRLLFILNRFDRAGIIFKGNRHFQLLRNLCNPSKKQLSLVLISCRTIEKIEKKAGSSSPFYRHFELPIRLATFSDEDLKTYFSKFSEIGISVTENDRNRILHYCGAHPYLLQVLGHKIVEEFCWNKKIDVNKAAKNINPVFSSYYQRLTEFLEDVELLNLLLQILFNSSGSIKTDDKDELKHYGLIKENRNGVYSTYSEHFHNYLQELHQASTKVLLEPRSTSESLDTKYQALKPIVVPDPSGHNHQIFELFSMLAEIFNGVEKPDSPANNDQITELREKTENTLRDVVTRVMFTRYQTNNWFMQATKEYSVLKKIFNTAKKRKEEEENRRVGNEELSSENLIRFVSMNGLFKIILNKELWDNHFREIFGKEDDSADSSARAIWKMLSEVFIEGVRNLEDHSNRSLTSASDLTLFKGSCERFLEAVNQYKDTSGNSVSLELDIGNPTLVEQDQHTESRTVKTEAVPQGLNMTDQDHERAKQGESEREKLHQGVVQVVNRVNNTVVIESSVLQNVPNLLMSTSGPPQARVQKTAFQDQETFKLVEKGKNVKFEIGTARNGCQQVRNVVLAEVK